MSSPSMGVQGGNGQMSLYSWSQLSSHPEDRTNRSQSSMGFLSSCMRVVESEISCLLVAFLALVAEIGSGPVDLAKVSLGSSVSTLISISICARDIAVKGTGKRIGLSLSSILSSSTQMKRKVLVLGSSRRSVVLNWGYCRGGVEVVDRE